MSKPWCAFFKRAIAFAAVSATFVMVPSAFAVKSPAPSPTPVLPTIELVFKSGMADQKAPHVGDVVPYELKGSPSDWQIDPKEGALTKGFLFRKVKLFIPLVPGKLQLPSLGVVNGTGEIVAHTDPVEISAETNLPQAKTPGTEPPKAEPAIGPLGLPFPMWIQTAVGFSILAVVLIAAFFLFRTLKRRAAKALKAMIPKKPYDLLALERLDGLAKVDLRDPKAVKKLYFTVSETLKMYLGERYSMDAEESTTSELLTLLSERSGISGLNESIVMRVSKLFTWLDPVKFADVIPTDNDAKLVVREAKDIILATRKEKEKEKEEVKK